MAIDDPHTEADSSLQLLTSEGLATIIIDALFQAGIVQQTQVRKAIEIAAEEIDARKYAGDY